MRAVAPWLRLCTLFRCRVVHVFYICMNICRTLHWCFPCPVVGVTTFKSSDVSCFIVVQHHVERLYESCRNLIAAVNWLSKLLSGSVLKYARAKHLLLRKGMHMWNMTWVGIAVWHLHRVASVHITSVYGCCTLYPRWFTVWNLEQSILHTSLLVSLLFQKHKSKQQQSISLIHPLNT